MLAARPDAVVLRPRAIWGPGDTTLLPRILARVRGGRLPLPDGGRHPMSTTHISSLTTAVAAALERPAVAGPVNVADATPTTPARLLGTLFEALGMNVPHRGGPGAAGLGCRRGRRGCLAPRRPSNEPPITRYAVAGLARPFTLDLGRLHRELGVEPDVDVAWAARAARRPRRRPMTQWWPGRTACPRPRAMSQRFTG